MVEAEDDGRGERRARPDADGSILGEVGERDVLVALEVVDRRTVVEDDLTGEVLLLDGLRLGAAGTGDIGGLAQDPVAGGKRDLAVGVRVVVVGHGELTARLEEHPLKRLALGIAGGERLLDGLDRLGGFVEGRRTGGGDAHLGLAVAFGHGAGEFEVVADADVADGVGE